MMKAKFTVLLLLLQRLWMLSLGQTIIVSKGSNNAHHKLSSKHILKQPSLPDIVTGEKKETLFPEVYYPESILDLNQPMYYNQEALEIKQSGSNKDSGDILLKTAAPIFGNYKRKQRLRALNDLYKKVNNTVVNDYKFDDDDRKHHDETQQRGIKWRDQVYINKILAKEPYVNTLVKEKPESKISKANTKDIFKYTAPTLQTKSNQTVFNDNPLMDYQMQLIVADLIDITEQIFDSVLVYISDNRTIENLSGDEIVEIIQVVENLNKVLDILEYLSTDFMSSKVENDNDKKILVISEFTASPSEAETVLPDINQKKNSTSLSLTEVVDGAILKVDSILNNTFPTLDNCSGEISKATYEMVNSLKQILVVMEELNTNVSSSSDLKSSKSVDISGDLSNVDVSGVSETIIDGKYGNTSTIFVQEDTDPTELKDVLTQSNLNSSLHNIENVISDEIRNISIKNV